MANLNEVRLIGRLTRDPEVRMLPSGGQVASFGLAINRKYRKADGSLQEETAFVDITCWGKQAELVYKYMKKGRLIFISGRLRYESWDDKNTGQKRSRLSVVGENIQFLDWKDAEGAPPSDITYENAPPMGGGSKSKEKESMPPADMVGEEAPHDDPPF